LKGESSSDNSYKNIRKCGVGESIDGEGYCNKTLSTRRIKENNIEQEKLD